MSGEQPRRNAPAAHDLADPRHGSCQVCNVVRAALAGTPPLTEQQTARVRAHLAGGRP